MVDQSKSQEVMTRIYHLLNKTVDKGATIHEAAAAAALAQKLMFKFNLDLAEVSKAGGPKSEFQRVPLDLHSAHTWKRELFFAICACNFGKGYIWTKTRKATILAEPHNAQVIEYLYNYLEREIMRLANDGWYENGGVPRGKNYEGESEGVYKDRFGRGAMTSIVARLYAQRTASKTESNQSTALVIVKEEELANAALALFPDSRDLNSRVTGVASSSWYQGVKAGRTIPIQPVLAGGK